MPNPTNDLELLKRFVAHRDEQAFDTIVQRHLSAVFSVALRKTGDHHLAQDVTQNVFTALAKRANKLRPDTVLVAWLHRVATTESAEALRREYKHRRTMAAIHADNTPPAAEATVPELFPALDEAIQSLPATDRDALLLRYASGHDYAEIGASTGKSAEASRKQVSRAVEKLAAILSKRGATVPSAILAATLGTSFTTSAPAALATTVSAAAITAASAPFYLQLLAVMAQAKLKLTILAATVIVVGTTSFVAGRTGASSFATTLTVTHTSRPQHRPELPSLAETVALESPEDRTRRILNRAAAILRGQDENAIAYYQAELLVSTLGASEIPTALAFVESLDGSDPLTTSLTPLVLGAWAKTDGATAMAYVETNLEGDSYSRSCGQVLPGWSRQDPHAAFNWFRAKSDSGDVGMNITSFRWLGAKIFHGWIETSTEAAVTAFTNLTVEDERAAALGIARAHNASLDPIPIRNAIKNLPPSDTRATLVEQVAQDWASEEPQAAAAWLDSIPGLDPRQLLKAKSEVAEEWLRIDRTELFNIGAWVLSGTPIEFHDDILEGISRELVPDSQ